MMVLQDDKNLPRWKLSTSMQTRFQAREPACPGSINGSRMPAKASSTFYWPGPAIGWRGRFHTFSRSWTNSLI